MHRDLTCSLQSEYELIIRPIEQQLMLSVWRITQNGDGVDDAFQEAMTQIWQRLPRIRSHPNPQALANGSTYGLLDGDQVYEIGLLLTGLGYRAVAGVILGIYKDTIESLVIGVILGGIYFKDLDYIFKNISPLFNDGKRTSLPKIYDVGSRLDNFISAVRSYVASQGLSDLLSNGTGNAKEESTTLFLAADDVLTILGKLQ